MTHRPLFVFLLSNLVASTNAQYEPDTLRPLPLVCDVFVLPGGQAESMYAIGLDQWRQLAPKSELLSRDLSDHIFNTDGIQTLTSNTGLALSIALRIGGAGRTKRSGAYLRAGFAYHSHQGNDLYLRHETRTAFDTLTSAQTGQVTLVDSLTISRYALNHTYRQVALDASVIWLKEYPKRWSLYGGAGAQLGMAIGGLVNISHTVERRTDPSLVASSGSGLSHSNSDISRETEQFRSKDDLCFALYVPLGVSYRLGRQRAFWRAMNLTYEIRPALAFGGVPELSAGARVGLGQYLGLRVDLVK